MYLSNKIQDQNFATANGDGNEFEKESNHK